MEPSRTPLPRTPSRRRRLVSATAAAVVLLGGGALAATSAPASAAPTRAGWVGSWATAVSTTSSPGFENTTLRQVVHLSVGGSSVRVRLTNQFGTAPLVVNATTVARRGADGGASVEGLPVPVTFSGAGDVTLAPGTERVSDPIGLTVADDSDLVISTFLPGPTGPATGRGGAWATSWSATGDASRSAGDAYARLGTSWYFLDGVDVSTRSSGAVVLFGDSITEGCCSASSVDTNTRYGDFLADRLLQGNDAQEMGVLNAGISGNQLLNDAGNAGVNALARFERDVLGQTGARSVVVLEGINDIGRSLGAVTPEQLIAVYRQMILRAHDDGMKIFGGTLTPYGGAGYYSEAGEQDRQAVNRWIRSSGEFDGVVDFDKAIRDPQDPSKMLSVYDPGDHLHPNAAGYAAMAAAVRTAVLR